MDDYSLKQKIKKVLNSRLNKKCSNIKTASSLGYLAKPQYRGSISDYIRVRIQEEGILDESLRFDETKIREGFKGDYSLSEYSRENETYLVLKLEFPVKDVRRALELYYANNLIGNISERDPQPGNITRGFILDSKKLPDRNETLPVAETLLAPLENIQHEGLTEKGNLTRSYVKILDKGYYKLTQVDLPSDSYTIYLKNKSYIIRRTKNPAVFYLIGN